KTLYQSHFTASLIKASDPNRQEKILLQLNGRPTEYTVFQTIQHNWSKFQRNWKQKLAKTTGTILLTATASGALLGSLAGLLLPSSSLITYLLSTYSLTGVAMGAMWSGLIFGSIIGVTSGLLLSA